MTAFVLLVALTVSILVTPFVAVAQPAGKVTKIGFLMSGSATAMTRNFEAFTQVLRELGYIEGQHITLEQRYDEGRSERLPVLAAELVSLKIEVCVVNTNRVAEAVQQTTTPIPIVMTTAEEPVHFGLAKSLARPGGTITGVAVMPGAEIYGKNLELLKELLPPGTPIGVLFNATAPVNTRWLHATEEAAQANSQKA